MYYFSIFFIIANSISYVIAYTNSLRTRHPLVTNTCYNGVNKMESNFLNRLFVLTPIDRMMRECALNDPSIPNGGHLIHDVDTELLKSKIQQARRAKGLIKVPKYNISATIGCATNYAQEIASLVDKYNNQMEDPERGEVFYEPRGLRQADMWDKDILLEVFPVNLEEGAPITPGQISKLSLDENHRSKIVESMRFNRLVGVCIAFIKSPESDSPNSVAELVDYGSICELLDISELDTDGVVIIRPIERFKIVKFTATPGDTHMKAYVRLIKDKYRTLRNLSITLDNVKALFSLYDKCNFLHEQYCKLMGREEQMKTIAQREDFNSKLDDMISHIEIDMRDPNLLTEKEISPTRMRIFEVISFCAMEFHCDENTRLWATKITDTEERLIAVRLILEKKMLALKAAIEKLKKS